MGNAYVVKELQRNPAAAIKFIMINRDRFKYITDKDLEALKAERGVTDKDLEGIKAFGSRSIASMRL